MKTFYTFLGLLTWCSLSAQDIKGVVCDEITKDPIEGVSISSNDDFTTTDNKGRFHLSVGARILSLQHLSYDDKEVNLTWWEESDTIFLRPTAFLMDRVTVKSKREINRIEVEKRFKIKSIVQVDTTHFLMYSQKYLSSDNKLSLYDFDGNEIAFLELNFKTNSLYKTCDKKLYVLDKHYGYQIKLDVHKIQLIEKVRLSKIKKIYNPCLFESNGKFVFEYLMLNDLVATYILLAQGQKIILKDVVDPALVEDYFEDYAFIKGVDMTNNMGDINQSRNEQIRNNEERRDFLMQVVYKKNQDNYVQKKGDHFYLFNCQQDSVHIFEDTGKEIKSTHVTYPDNVKFITADYQLNEFYAITKEGPYKNKIWRISEDLQFEKILTLDADTVIDMFISNNRIFYLKSLGIGDDLTRSLCFEDL